MPLQASYGLRKVEAKVLGIYVMDPFGIGLSSSTFSRILKTGEPYVAKYFQLLLKPEVVEAKKKGFKIVVGGPGAWQLKLRKTSTQHGIDCIIEGEAENIITEIFRKAIEGEELPRFHEVDLKDSPNLDEIPEIKNPSINGLIEIGRGCDFSSTTLRPLCWYPYEKIENELEVNVNAGIDCAIVHAEDVLLYGL
ncbi:MAG: hypothetical protein QXL25_05930 [Candidatus Bathyarchaeia archaeon]